MLELDRSELLITRLTFGTTPIVLHELTNGAGPAVIVAHGFAGSIQLMQEYSSTIARAGYRVVAFDFEGHGLNPIPMSGDVTAVEGTTALLFAQTREVISASWAFTNS